MHIFDFIGPLLKRLRSGASLDPIRDWLVLLTLTTITLIGIIVWNVWAFQTVAGGGIIGEPPAALPSTFSRTSLDAINAIFASRAAEEAKYVTGVYRYADPSQ